jgi:hypothetical protein
MRKALNSLQLGPTIPNGNMEEACIRIGCVKKIGLDDLNNIRYKTIIIKVNKEW